MPQNSLYRGRNWVLPNLYMLASISTNKAWWSLLLGTPVFVAEHVNLMVTQAKKVGENQFQLHKGAQRKNNEKEN